MIRGLGYLPDRPKLGILAKRDWAWTSGGSAPPPAASARELVVDVLQQGALGSCVANAAAQAIRASHMRQGVDPRLASRLFLYYLARAYDHTTKVDSGTYLRTCFEACNKFGVPPEELWPYDDDSSPGAPFTQMPATKAFHDAFDQRTPTVYRRIFETGEARLTVLKHALAAGYLVCFGTDVSTNFVNDIGTRDVVEHGGPAAGGHAMCFVGYDGDVFDVVNSWGTEWGVGGFCRFAPEYVMWDQTRDLWIVEHSPVYSRAA